MLHVGSDLQVHVLQINASLSLRQFMFFLSKIFYKIYNILTSHLKSSNIVTFQKCVVGRGHDPWTPLAIRTTLTNDACPACNLWFCMVVSLQWYPWSGTCEEHVYIWFKCILHNIWYWSFDQRFYSPQSWYSKQKTF